jgi:hypothetical protein
MTKFIVGLLLGLSIAGASAELLSSKEIDCPPGGKIIIYLPGSGGGGGAPISPGAAGAPGDPRIMMEENMR